MSGHEKMIVVTMYRVKRTGWSSIYLSIYLDTGAKPGHAAYATRYGVLSPNGPPPT